MKKLTLKRKVHLHVFIPVTSVFILNNLILMTLETPGYLIINLMSYGLVMSLSIYALRNFGEEKKIAIHTVEDFSEESETIDEVYEDLKVLLTNCLQKESLPIAKELVKICSDLGPVAETINYKVPKENPFPQGSLRRAYKRDVKKAA